MRHVWLAALGLAIDPSAWAQRPATRPAQPPPLQQQTGVAIPPSRPSPGASGVTTQRPTLPDGQRSPVQVPPVQGGPQTSVPALSAPSQTTTMRPDAWLPAKVVRLQALDKVNAQTTALTITVGQSATFGSLTIDAKSCVVRPPDRPADAAAYLAVTDSHGDSPRFDGWMLLAEPALSMMQHPVYDIRVAGCA